MVIYLALESLKPAAAQEFIVDTLLKCTFGAVARAILIDSTPPILNAEELPDQVKDLSCSACAHVSGQATLLTWYGVFLAKFAQQRL